MCEVSPVEDFFALRRGKAPQGNFCHERQKSPKTPVETNGFNTSFARLWRCDIDNFSHANQISHNFGEKTCIIRYSSLCCRTPSIL